MTQHPDLISFIDSLEHGKFSELIEAYWNEESKEAQYGDFPEYFHPEIISGINKTGVQKLYVHQIHALNLINQGHHVLITSGTSSGKSFCFQLPIAQSQLIDPSFTSLLLFPTKALAEDQNKKLIDLFKTFEDSDLSINPISVYDGDKNERERIAIRNKCKILLTNPDMLHLGILPHHTKWFSFFQSLKYIIIDEVHIYRGIFGSHFTNLIRRLKRIASFYGANPKFIMTSATISNAKNFCESLVEEQVRIVDSDYAGRSEKHYFFLNPPIENPELGLRKGMVDQSIEIANELISLGAQCILFARSRKTVEVSLRQFPRLIHKKKPEIHGYRSGYLTAERRDIEAGLRSGKIQFVIATNALELGIDMGKVDVVIMMGYPGSIASFFQQSGRAGRRNFPSITLLIASSSPIDQFIIQNSDFIKLKNPEEALINPNNPIILKHHLRCAVHELPISTGDQFGNLDWKEIYPVLVSLKEEKEVLEKSGKFYWRSIEYPASNITIRGISESPVQLILNENSETTRIGEVDYDSAQKLVHPGAVYLHDGNAFRVASLDLENHTALLKSHDADYLTEPRINQNLVYGQIENSREIQNASLFLGDLQVTENVTGFKKKNWEINQIIDVMPLDLPERVLFTKGFWMCIDEETTNFLRDESRWLDAPIDYGINWKRIRQRVLIRDAFACQNCGNQGELENLHVHHKVPIRTFPNIEMANQLSNLITLCPKCHKLAEQNVRIRSGLSGFSYIFAHIAPLYLMCDMQDIGYSSDPAARCCNGLPSITIFDQHPGGIGLSAKIFEVSERIIKSCQDVIIACPCNDGCPACVGPSGENSNGSKKFAKALVERLANNQHK